MKLFFELRGELIQCPDRVRLIERNRHPGPRFQKNTRHHLPEIPRSSGDENDLVFHGDFLDVWTDWRGFLESAVIPSERRESRNLYLPRANKPASRVL